MGHSAAGWRRLFNLVAWIGVAACGGGGGGGPPTPTNNSVQLYSIGGVVTGLAGVLKLQNNAGETLELSADGSFSFGTALRSGAVYAVTVLAQPGAPSQTCTVANGAGNVGSADIGNVTITCTTNRFNVGGSVSGLVGTGLVLRNNGGNDLVVGANGAFTFSTSLASGAAYAVTVLAQPGSQSQTCTVGNGAGNVGPADIGNVTITCTTNRFTVGGSVSGLVGTGLVLRNNGGNDLALAANGAFTFSTPLASGAAYAVTVPAQPGSPSQTCTVANGAGVVASANVSSVSVSCVYLNPNPPTLKSSAVSAYIGQTIRFDATGSDPNNLPLTYLWNFGDGAGASGSSVDHAYTRAGTFVVRLQVFNSGGGSASGTLSQSVVSTVVNAFVPDCAGVDCAALSPTTYGGTGTGVWRYTNSTSTATAIDLNIGGMTPGRSVTLLFSNGSSDAAASLPNPGVLAIPLAAPAALAAPARATSAVPTREELHDAAHTRLLAENQRLARSLAGSRRSASATSGSAPAPRQPAPTPALNAPRVWNDLFVPGVVTPYPTTAQAICPSGNGRNVVVWVDPNAQASGKVTPSNVTAFANTFCGDTGSFARVTALLGDAWGPGAAAFSYLIPDTPLRDINIVVLDVPTSTAWAGYFYSANNYLATSQAGSNEALVFFINANTVQSNLNFALSALVHEATHMINYYQRSVVRGASHDTWLEETSALMSEDIVAPTVVKNADGSGYNSIAQSRVPNYLGTGGAVSYINWAALSNPNYALGGSFGAYVNRRFGLSVYRQLVTSCDQLVVSSYACLDTLMRNNGGLSFSDEFARFGATIFATLPDSGMPTGYGYPAKLDGGYSLLPIDVSALAAQRPLNATPLGVSYSATTHTYQIDTVPAGKTTYVRNGVVVPANTTLLVVVR